MQIDNTGIHLGTLNLGYFSLFLVLGLMTGGAVSLLAAKRRAQGGDHVLDALSWAILIGILGARLAHVLAPPPSMAQQGLTTRYYLTHLFNLQDGLFAIWAGGLNVLGGLAGGLLGLWIYTRRQKLEFPLWADIAAVGALPGIAVASLGNLTNRQLLGPPTALPWAFRVGEEGIGYHPLPAYLAVWVLVAAGVLFWIARRYAGSMRDGDLLLWMVILLAPGLFLFEILRSDRLILVAGISVVQVVVVLIFTCLIVWQRTRSRLMITGADGA